MPKVVASVSDEDIRRRFYETTAHPSMWITELDLDPLHLIVCDDKDGKYYRIPVALAEEGGDFVFGDAAEVAVRYIEASAAPPVQSIVYASAEESRAGVMTLTSRIPNGDEPDDEPPAPKETPAQAAARIHAAAQRAVARAETPDVDTTAGQPDKTKEASGMAIDAAKLREALGLSADAPLTDETRAELAKALGLAVPAAKPADPIAALLSAIPEGARVKILDEDNYKELVVRASKGEQAWERMERGERDVFLDKACRDGRFPPAKLSAYQAMWDENPTATRKFVELMPKNSVPTFASGIFGTEQTLNEADEAYVAVYGRKEG